MFCWEPAIEKLSFHFQGKQTIVFEEYSLLEDMVSRNNSSNTKFLEWMHINKWCEDARELTYDEFPT